MMKKRILLPIIAAAAALVLLFVGITTAYFTEVEVRDNNITIGKIDITLDEGGFDQDTTYPVVPGTKLSKAPTITNTGNQDEYVFMRITVPTAEVTLLNESGERTPKTGLSGVQQLFKLISAESTTNTSVPDQSGKDIEFTYKSGSAENYGWVLLETYSKTGYDEYVFGYNKKLAPTDETVTLFDEVQLKSFVDNEKKGPSDIGVYCYGIQAKNLQPSGTYDLTETYLSTNTLNAIYTIVKNKAGLS